MKEISINVFILSAMTILSVLSSCKPMDLRSPELKASGLTEENIAKGKALLQAAVKAHGLDAMLEYQVYRMHATDEWNKQYGMNINPWPGENGALLEYQMVFGTFDSRVKWLEGEMEGEIFGMQSWQVYASSDPGTIEKVNHKELRFLLPTMQYFMELPYRLSKAPIISYMGEEEFEGLQYQRVFATWDGPEPNSHDQYVLYIHPESHLLGRVTYTIRDNFMWTPKNFYGTAVYSDFRQVDNVIFPFKMAIYPFDHTHKKKVHSFSIKEIHLGDFNLELLYPFDDLSKLGDSK